MTRGKDENHAYIYQPTTGEADHERTHLASGAEIHTNRRGNKYAAAHYFRMILANDDRPRTMHAQADRTDRELPPLVAPCWTATTNAAQPGAPRGGNTAPKRVDVGPPTSGSIRRRATPRSGPPSGNAVWAATASKSDNGPTSVCLGPRMTVAKSSFGLAYRSGSASWGSRRLRDQPRTPSARRSNSIPAGR
jgi:hypothetical protein